jgi:hypothetical protein
MTESIDDLPIIDGDTPTAPVTIMPFSSPRVSAKDTPPLSVVDAVVEEINAAYAVGHRAVSEAAALTCWHIGQAVQPIIGECPSIQQLYETLSTYGAEVGSRSNFYRCVNAYKYWPQGLPEGADMGQVKRVSAGNEPMPTVQEKPKKKDVHALVIDRIGQVWGRGDMQVVAAYMGFEPVDEGVESVDVTGMIGGVVEAADMPL